MHLPNIRQRLLKQRKFRQLLLALIGVSFFLGILVVSVEKEVGNIKTISEGLWWASTTITAVGYGDYAPVTGPGRVIGVALQVMGVVMFGLLIAIISTSMNRSQEEYFWKKLFKRLDELEKEVQKMHKKTDYMVKENGERE
ncbi:potassium channel family protein [Patescibacteria group bacterium]|nr:potassium channel family protein [Patescibacteria group bacterium]MBU1967228.1 potassium channel family protein [Patescibacteria group bacterium]MBU2543077.1 potassium channel family protein [Patescibacteria group bacterium]